MPSIDASGTELHYERAGGGEPMLLIQGMSATHLAWGRPFLDQLERHFDLIVFDNRGMGLSGPASNNAALDLVPEKAASITGIRGLFRSTGGVLGTALFVLVLELSPDKAAGLRSIFGVLSLILLATIPIVFLIPDTARERLQRDRALARAVPAEVHGGE